MFFYFSIILFLIGLLAWITTFNGYNLIMLIISLELLLLSIGILFVHFSFILDDNLGNNFTLYLLPLAGAESAIALAILIAYYPTRGTMSIN